MASTARNNPAVPLAFEAAFLAMSDNPALCAMYGVALIIAARILTNASSRCYNAYCAGVCHDREAAAFEAAAMAAMIAGVFMLLCVLALSGARQGGREARRLPDEQEAQGSGVSDRVIRIFDEKITEVEGEILGGLGSL